MKTYRTAPPIGSLLPSQRSRRVSDAETAAAVASGADLSHTWVGAATVKLDEKQAKYANFRQSFKTKQVETIYVLETYCSGCKKPYDDVADAPCSAKINNEHLIGGDQSVRAPRKPVPALRPGHQLIPGPRVNRRGIEAVVRGEV